MNSPSILFNRRKFLERIEQELVNRGITARQMTQEAGLGSTHLSVMRQSRTAPSVDNLIRYLHWLGDTDVSPYITTEHLPPTPPPSQPHSGQLDIMYYLDVESCTFRTLWSDEDGQFVATCDQLPSLSWLAGTEKAALDGLKQMMHGMQIQQANRIS